MVRVISQETFDLVVAENMEEFSMEQAEAVRDAREQFQQQGINLANIVVSEMGSQRVVRAVKALFQEQSSSSLLHQLATVRECCATDLAQRVLATDSGAYSVLLRLARESTPEVQCEVLSTLCKVMDTNPDHLEAQGLELIYSLLDSQSPVVACTLDWLLVCSVRHEGNRQSAVDRPGLLHKLAELAKGEDKEVLVRVCRVWVQLVQDDDVRVPFGKAHDHARDIVENHGALTLLTRAMVSHHPEDKEVVALCLLALASLTLRNEYCQSVVDEGGLTVLMDIFSGQRGEVELVTRGLVLLKVLAGNDQVKTEIYRTGGIPLVMAAITQYLPRAATAEAGCNAIASVCLRQSDNAKQVVLECEGASVITALMEKHMAHSKTQAAAAAAIRNIVSRDKELCGPFIEREVEGLLNQSLTLHGEKYGDTLRSALRDLDLKVELQERWTGEKIKITESFEETEGVH